MMVRAAARTASAAASSPLPSTHTATVPSRRLAACAVASALLCSSSSSSVVGASRPVVSAAARTRPAAAFLIPRTQTPGAAAAAAAAPLRPLRMSSSSSSAASEPSAADPSDAAISDVPIAQNLEGVRSRIAACLSAHNLPPSSARLVAVSKTKPLNLLAAAYDAGQRHFGENYAQECMSKAEEMPDDVRWHFIGPLQSNKAAPLVKRVGLDKLACVETVSTMKLANKLNRAAGEMVAEAEEAEGVGGEGGEKKKKTLGIYLQVNTSGESTKSGASPGPDLVALASSISRDCPHLSIDGLMTIGAPGDYTCFDALVQCREEVAEELGRDVESLDLSMGMSGDFEEAIKRGATSVRVGSTIFGARDYSNLGKK